MELETVCCSGWLVKFYQKRIFHLAHALKSLNLRLAALFHVRKIIVGTLTQEMSVVTGMLFIFFASNSFTFLHTTTTTATRKCVISVMCVCVCVCVPLVSSYLKV